MDAGSRRLALAAAALLLSSPVQAEGPASFREIAERGGILIVSRCQTAGERPIRCEPLEAWRGAVPEVPIVISREDWSDFSIGAPEERPGATFLMILKPADSLGCALLQTESDLELEILGNVGTCVLPIVENRLPRRVRPSYDGSQGPSLSAEELKADLLKFTMTPFVILAAHSECSQSRNRLFRIDETLVYWERQGPCADYGYGFVLFDGSVENVLCSLSDSIMGPQGGCKDPSYREMFDTLLKDSSRPDLGLGSGHTVEEIPVVDVPLSPEQRFRVKGRNRPPTSRPQSRPGPGTTRLERQDRPAR